MENLEHRPKIKRSGFFDSRYFFFFILDSLHVFLIGFLPAKLIFSNAGAETSWALLIVLFGLIQIIGFLNIWTWLSFSFRIHHVRRWWFHLGLNLYFAYVFQAGAGVPIWDYLMSLIGTVSDDSVESAAYLTVAWMTWAICAPLIVKSIGLWVTCHEALRVHYVGQGWAQEKHYYFKRSSGKKIEEALAIGDGETLRSLLKENPTKKPFGLGGYTVMTISVPNEDSDGKCYLHLKEVFLSGTILWDRKVHRTFGFSRLHHVEITDEEVEHLQGLLGQ